MLTEVLEHLNFHPVPTLRKLRSLLAEDGRLFLSTPDSAEWGRVTKHYGSLAEIPPPQPGRPLVDDHVWQYSRSELLSVVREAGLDVVRFAYAPGVVSRHLCVCLKRSA